MFPKLRKAVLTESKHVFTTPSPAFTHDRIMLIKQFLGPSVVHLSLDVGNVSLEGTSLRLFTVLGMCSQLKVMQGEGLNDSEDVASAFSDSVCLWHDLEELTCVSLNDTALKHLASLKSFRRLDMDLPSYRIYSNPILAGLRDPGFPAIQSFRFRTLRGTLSDIAGLVDSLQPPQGRLSLLNFNALAYRVSETSIITLGQSLASTFDTSTLVNLSITESGNSGLLFKIDDMRSLFPFRSLSSIDIDTRRAVGLDDVTLLQMTEAWPGLNSLVINELTGWTIQPRVTLRGLRDMLKKLPQLKKLTVAIDGDSVLAEDIKMKNLGHFSICRPFTLNLLDSRITASSVPEAAAFLADIFPHHGIGNCNCDIWSWSVDIHSQETLEPERREFDDDFQWDQVFQTVHIINQVGLMRSGKPLRYDSDGAYDSGGAYDSDGSSFSDE
ncbi:hypothetical protein CONPUDRAFT_140795 [Coniophora puteana RWD-64-598 SS2]|uniref:RNI-like protein n=1 Tax=Coniophora puteana (strain RWD-64-598) TaxID=741705 RepID=A0A5M3N4T5_CONPW|nr:uncharacterized protein CONPUDRAFT_140795 [Coniophora puteana RWD-64-598 SS2]EIW86064.1 hypothetical protein CONPUDRAFT_140795 [Coniophora puteana RWD-64-598 SS2]